MTGPRPSEQAARSNAPRDGEAVRALLPQDSFLKVLQKEERRTSRSHRAFILMLMTSARMSTAEYKGETLPKLARALSQSTRETDIKGWYQAGKVLGVIFTEIGSTTPQSAISTLSAKTERTLSTTLSDEQLKDISLSFHAFPEAGDKTGNGNSGRSILHPEFASDIDDGRASRLLTASYTQERLSSVAEVDHYSDASEGQTT